MNVWFVRSVCYNRIVVNGESFARAVVPLSAKPFNFQKEYRLTEEQVTATYGIKAHTQTHQ